MPSWSARSRAGSSLGGAPVRRPSGARTCARPVARASSSSLQTSTDSESTSPMPARILARATLCLPRLLLLPQGGRRLERLFDGGHEARGVVAVDDAVVDGDREVHEVANDDRAVSHGGPLRDLVHAEDRDLGVIDDGRGQQAAELTEARDREGRARELLARRLA